MSKVDPGVRTIATEVVDNLITDGIIDSRLRDQSIEDTEIELLRLARGLVNKVIGSRMSIILNSN